ncbi:MAG: orotidine-5'-phosphate decarboxylase [Thermoprotei archaeon]|nr:MAG: orotidine-5'-phosphate decarboxylase [Thermoprotei archaeon]RLE94194.1 MAG: orotidine-5'-phosphate decarboxylase [Thermoprotei archaeon]
MRPVKLWEIAEAKESRVIVAIDVPIMEPHELVGLVKDYAAGIKVGLPALLRWGPGALRRIREEYGEELYLLCDFKLADIPYVVAEELKAIREMGFDGAILHLFQGGVEEVVTLEGRPDLYGVVAMSHPQAERLNSHFKELLAEAIEAGLEGCVVPATREAVVREAREAAPGLTLLAPGIGAQGARPGSAVAAGADFEIVGRAITRSPDPRLACMRVRDAINAALKALKQPREG